MSKFKDHFSKQSMDYGKFRPTYPEEIYRHLAKLALGHDLVWDCATGTGQAARGLSNDFRRVDATDGSADQIRNSFGPDNISFRVATAENSGLKQSSADMVTVAQALHWFDHAAFNKEVQRVLKPGGIIATWTYNLLHIEASVDSVVQSFDQNIVGEYWPPERQLVIDQYRTIIFPYQEIAMPEFAMTALWTLEELVGYLRTWSSVSRFKTTEGHDPLQLINEDLLTAWGDIGVKKRVTWPLSFRVGRFRP